jgi:hypothetical protein
MSGEAGVTPPQTHDGLPPGITRKPPAKEFLPPVAWLFGRQFLAAFKWILVYTAFKGKLDPRDWMKANIIPPTDSKQKPEQFWQQWAGQEVGRPDSEQEFWFDYISDTGDGQRAVYSIAYLCMSDLAAKRDPEIGDELEFVLQPGVVPPEADGKLLLPRGSFLFVGGDTSYHISDYSTLANRFQNPFCWAFADLVKSKASSVLGRLPRMLLGIPGNHDYYDALDGFNRQFRRPATGDIVSAGDRQPQLAIPAFMRCQEASYLALRLPFDWWFWGLDTEEGEIDYRQWEFFDDLQSQYAPRKLILATPEPTTVFGKYAKKEESVSKTFAALKLERPFLKDGEPIAPGKCRLDLSGDIHHYARYWGPEPASGEDSNYASIVSGGGGAFFHPSQTNIKEVMPKMVYPEEGESRREAADQIFKFKNIVKGGYVWLFGFLIAFSLFFTATFPESSKDAVDGFPPLVWLGISPQVNEQQYVSLPSYQRPVPRYTWTPRTSIPTAYYLWIISLALSIIMLGAALAYSTRIYKKEYDPTWKPPAKTVTFTQHITLFVLVFLAFVFLVYGLWGFRTYDLSQTPLTRFARSIIILVSLAWAVLSMIVSLKYSEWLFEKAHQGNIKGWYYAPPWVLSIMAVFGFGVSLWFFGKHEAAFLISDLVLLLVLLLVGGGLTYFAFSTGGTLQKGLGKVGFLLLGVSHALLQIAVPFLLIRKGHLLWAPLAALLIVIVFKYVGISLAKRKMGWLLALAWVLFGAALIAITYVPFLSRDLGLPENRWLQFLLCVYAGVIGAAMSCVLFGWYLSVALAFNGHNNEAGGAARIEGFKQLIRFRINRQGLTGYVIGVDRVNTEGGTGNLSPKIVDVFHLREQ